MTAALVAPGAGGAPAAAGAPLSDAPPSDASHAARDAREAGAARDVREACGLRETGDALDKPAEAREACGGTPPAGEDWLGKLNAEQREAVTHGGGAAPALPLLVIAGAGTGKTATLAHRVAWLVAEGADPQRILLLTFSRRAAVEMTRRAQRLLAARALGQGSREQGQSREQGSEQGREGGAGMAEAGTRMPVATVAANATVALVTPNAARLEWAGTFHAIGARLLREYADQVGLDPGFGILDRGDAADLMDLVRQAAGFDRLERRFPRKDTCLAIYSYCVNSRRPLAEVVAAGWPWAQEHVDRLAELFQAYVARKFRDAVLDFDDLLLWWQQAMAEPAFAAAVGARFDHVLVDEYQDTNRLQADIVHAMKPDGRGVTVVGDDAQSIYGFRAAEVDNILDFGSGFAGLKGSSGSTGSTESSEPAEPAELARSTGPEGSCRSRHPPGPSDPDAAEGVRRVTLKTNYRSVQPVLDLAETLMSQSPRQFRKTLVAQRGTGARPRLVTVLDDRAQAEHVIARVLEEREAGIPLKRQAVLFRSAHHSDLLEVELTRARIPFVKYGGLKFLEAAHVKDVLAVLRWADNPRHEVAAFRCLQLLPGIGPGLARRCLERLAAADHDWAGLARFSAPPAAAEAWPGLVDLLLALADPSTPWTGQLQRICLWYRPLLEARHDDFLVRAADLDMLTAIADQFASRERFLTETTLDPPSASGDLAGDPLRDEDYLILSTVHSAKGQEWDAVHVLNVADGNFPNEFSTGSAAGIDEERRLFYVAITRARDTLELIEPQRYYVTQQPRTGDRHVHGARSRFLTKPVMACLDRRARVDTGAAMAPAAVPAPRVDVAGRISRMWETIGAGAGGAAAGRAGASGTGAGGAAGSGRSSDSGGTGGTGGKGDAGGKSGTGGRDSTGATGKR